jgi:hypothetical protein
VPIAFGTSADGAGAEFVAGRAAAGFFGAAGAEGRVTAFFCACVAAVRAFLTGMVSPDEVACGALAP